MSVWLPHGSDLRVSGTRGAFRVFLQLWSFFRTDVSDPYCVLSLGAETATTTTVSNSLDPVCPVPVAPCRP